MRGAFLTIVLSYLLLLGLSYPFAALLTYVWIDIVRPQALAYSLINDMPISMVAAVVSLLSYMIKGERQKEKIFTVVYLLIFFAAWITYTTVNADPGIESWLKWDWAFKVVIFSIFVPFVIRSQVQIEAFLLVIILSVTTISFTAGVKAALGGGGYGFLAVMGTGNSGLSEGSTLATICVMLLPILHYLYNHSIIFPDNKIFKALIFAIAIVNIFAIIGTFARTGLIASAFLLLLYFFRSKHKWAMALVLVIAFAGIQQMDLGGTAWGERMLSIGTYQQDSSASGRIVVWKWTVNYAIEHPLGGGFDSFKLNKISGGSDAGVVYFEGPVLRGKAFHNIVFEVLGEQGFVGLIVYLTILAMTFLNLRKIRRDARGKPDLVWSYDLATRLRDALAVVLVGGMFIGIAYQCYIFYLVVIVVSFERLIYNESKKFNLNISHAKKY